MKKLLLSLLALLFFISGCTTQPTVQKKDYWAKPLKELHVQNLHKVDAKLYRSAQPSKDDFKKLYIYGIRNDLNLRQFHDDKDELEGINIQEYHLPINTSKMSYKELVEAVAYLDSRKEKTLVHCKHGSDRTGTVVAGYRIAVNGWSKEKAIDEFVHGGFGYHSFWFPNLPKLLNSLDVEKFKKDIKATQKKRHF
jgi:protein tyrosine phosphatase (PTP) superfamily phosphohydrolase (DUF442 family)